MLTKHASFVFCSFLNGLLPRPQIRATYCINRSYVRKRLWDEARRTKSLAGPTLAQLTVSNPKCNFCHYEWQRTMCSPALRKLFIAFFKVMDFILNGNMKTTNLPFRKMFKNFKIMVVDSKGQEWTLEINPVFESHSPSSVTWCRIFM